MIRTVRDWSRFAAGGVAPPEHAIVMFTGCLTTFSRFTRKLGAALALAVAVASVPLATAAAPWRTASFDIQSATAPLGVVAAARGAGQLVAENRDHDVRPTPKSAPECGGQLPAVDPSATYAPIGDVATVATLLRDRRSFRFLPDPTGPPRD